MKRRLDKDNFFLTLDIGTETVKVLIFSPPIRNDEKILILGTGLQYFERYDVFNGKDFETGVIKRAISKAVEKAHQNLSFSLIKKELKERAQKQKRWQVLLGLPPNILKGRIVSQSFFREKPREKISLAEAEIIRHHVFEVAKKEISQRFAKEFGILPEDIHWISLKILEIKIDGYLVQLLRGYQGKNLEFKILVTFLPKYYWENIKKIVGSFQLEILRIVHLAESLPTLSKDKKKNGIFFDIGGEVSQFFLIKDSSLQQINEFKNGGKAFSQRLADTLGIDEESARILKERYSDKLLSAGAAKRIKEIFLREKEIWYESLNLKIKKIKFIDSAIFLFGGGSSLPEIQEVLKEKLLSGPLKVGLIYPKDLENIEDTTKSLNNPQSIPSLLICYHAQKFF